MTSAGNASHPSRVEGAEPAQPTLSPTETLNQARLNLAGRFARNRAAVAGAIILTILLGAAALAPVISDGAPGQQNLSASLAPPSLQHPFGTDVFGRDLWTRVLYGGRITLPMATGAVALAVIFGVPLGLVAGFYQGKLDSLIMRATDVLLSFPDVLLALSISAALGRGLWPVLISVGVVRIPVYIRLVRASTLQTKQLDFVMAARALGVPEWHIMLRHILPAALTPLIIQASLSTATAILQMSALSFLGLGPQAPTPEWGLLLSDGRSYLRLAPHIVLFPGMAITLAVLGFNLLGDGLRDALDVRSVTT
jgi:peptide/nickel transport system permease protein